MSSMIQTRRVSEETKPSVALSSRAIDEARILIVCDDDSIIQRLSNIFRGAGFVPECAKSITAGCASARSGRFQVVVSTPDLSDGSWRRLVDIANHYDLGFRVVLLARTFDLTQWAEALEAGAFDVLDALHELPKAVEVAKRALWAAYLKGPGPDAQAASPQKVSLVRAVGACIGFVAFFTGS